MSTIKVDTIATRTGSGNITLSNNVASLTSAGAISGTNLSASGTLAVTGNTTMGGTAAVTGNTTVGGTLTSTGKITSTAGITFGSDTAAANVFDDYEEGTWLPQYGGSNGDGSVTYTARVGVYTKIGRQVRVWGDIVVGSASGQSGIGVIKNLPYASASSSTLGIEGSGFSGQNEQRYDMGMLTFWDVGTNFTSSRTPTGWFTNGVSYILLYSWTGDTASGHTGFVINTTGRIAFSAWYTADN